MKKCSKCLIDKDLSEFHKNKSERDGYKYDCKECVLGHKPFSKAAITERCCKICLETKPLERFPYNGLGKIYRKATCKKCTNSKRQKVRDSDPEKEKLRTRKERLKRKYNITIEHYDSMVIAQDEKCEICNKCLKGKSMCVDHCHKTLKVRGLLCNKCNSSLGLLGENIETLNSMIGYINKYK